MLRVCESAPANIALIKYMGKISSDQNTPSNPSLSWSLKHLRTEVEIENSKDGRDHWRPLVKSGFTAPELSEKGQARFLQHAIFLKKHWNISDGLVVKSANNFPSDCGVASSASSFAALTKAVHQFALQTRTLENPLSSQELSELSRRGSGSSCRSLFESWSLWEAAGAKEVFFAEKDMAHALILLDVEKKQVSSSEAHQRVTTSSRFQGRPERAIERLKNLCQNLEIRDWKACFHIVRDEYIDMHELFETSVPPFAYRTDQSRVVDSLVVNFWSQKQDGPLITMDAGANMHLLWRTDQLSEANELHTKIRTMLPEAKWILSPHFNGSTK